MDCKCTYYNSNYRLLVFLSLAWATAQLGWLGGIATLLIFSGIMLYTSNLLADSYRTPDPITGKRNYTYMDEVQANLGKFSCIACGILQYANLTGQSKNQIASTKKGHAASCKFSNNPYMIGFGICEIFLSQIPNFHELTWLSTIAAIMSFAYSSIGVGLALERIISGKGGKTSLTGVEIGVDTLQSRPAENKVMKKANAISMLTTTVFYMMCGCLGYAAFGNDAPGNMLTGFGFYEPFWLIDLANIFIVIHIVGAYQVLAQPVYKMIESFAINKWPNSFFVKAEYPIRIGNKTVLSFNSLRLVGKNNICNFCNHSVHGNALLQRRHCILRSTRVLAFSRVLSNSNAHCSTQDQTMDIQVVYTTTSQLSLFGCFVSSSRCFNSRISESLRTAKLFQFKE
uniref:Amino acid transporter transmembrane domain-containing protein n=1 Tax=Chenopodium quinoa TaxID=63459 RepID=A0A803NC38_CHEQI